MRCCIPFQKPRSLIIESMILFPPSSSFFPCDTQQYILYFPLFSYLLSNRIAQLFILRFWQAISIDISGKSCDHAEVFHFQILSVLTSMLGLCVLSALLVLFRSLSLRGDVQLELRETDIEGGFSGLLWGKTSNAEVSRQLFIKDDIDKERLLYVFCRKLGFLAVERSIDLQSDYFNSYNFMECGSTVYGSNNRNQYCSMVTDEYRVKLSYKPLILSCQGPYFSIWSSQDSHTSSQGVLMSSLDKSTTGTWGPVCQYPMQNDEVTPVTRFTGRAICQSLDFHDLVTISTIKHTYEFSLYYPPMLSDLDFSEKGILSYTSGSKCASYTHYTYIACSCEDTFNKTPTGCEKICLENSYWDRESDACICNMNYYRSTEGPLTCTPCPGNLAAGKHQSSCVCPPGSFWESETGDCKVCSADTYNPSENATSCLTCPELSSASEDTTRCACPAGYRWRSNECRICIQNSFSKAGSDSCTSCPPFMVSSEGSESCSSCPQGYFYLYEGRLLNGVCRKCPDHLDGDGVNCFPCVHGWSNNTGRCLEREHAVAGITEGPHSLEDATNAVQSPRETSNTQGIPGYFWFIFGVLVTSLQLFVYHNGRYLLRKLVCCRQRREPRMDTRVNFGCDTVVYLDSTHITPAITSG